MVPTSARISHGAADDICYATIDLEDAVELNVLKPREAYTFCLVFKR